MRGLTVVLALAAAPAAARADLAFPVPAGWLDLSPGAPEGNFQSLPQDFVDMVRSGQFRAFAFDVAHTENGFTPNLNAVAMDQPVRITERNRDELVRALFGPIEKQVPGAKLVEQDLIPLSGVKALRIVYDSAQGGTPLRQMAVLVPGIPSSAVVTYSALRTQFPELRGTFEAHAASITGAQEPRGPIARATGDALVGGIAGGIVGAIAGVVAWRRRRAA
jgi:hypothetical protein